jgi:hypothetical protein
VLALVVLSHGKSEMDGRGESEARSRHRKYTREDFRGLPGVESRLPANLL